MLSIMRRNAGSWMIKVLLIGVALSFVIGFGILPTLKDKQGEGFIVAEVGGKRITRGELNQAYENLIRVYQRVYQDRFSDEMVKQLRLRETALDSLINQELQIQEARRLGLRVSDQELQAKIWSFPVFKRDGTFDRDVYLRVLRQNRLTPTAFEKNLREEILVQRLQELFQGTVKISDEELWRQYSLDKELVDLSVVKLDPKDFEDKVQVTETDLNVYLEKNSQQFLTPEKVKVEYVPFLTKKYRDQGKVYTGDIEEYYDSHIEEFSHPEELRLRHILLRVAPGADNSLIQEKRKVLEGLQKRINEGEDFAQLATAYSDDPASKHKGGDLGYMKKGEFVPEVERVVFSMKPGEVSDIVSSSYGLHLLKVEDFRTSNVDALESVSEKIREKLIQQKAWRLARRKAEELLWEVKKTGSFKDEAFEKGDEITVKETDFFSRGEVTPSLGSEQAFQRAAFLLDTGEMSEAVKGNAGYYILRLLEKKSPEVPDFESVKQRVEKRFREEKSKDLAREKAESVLKMGMNGKTFDELKDEEGLSVFDTGTFSRLRTYIPRIGSSPELVDAAFSLTEENPLPDKSFEINGNYYVVCFKALKPPEYEAYLDEKESLRKQQEQRKKQEVFRQWLSELRKQQGVKFTPPDLSSGLGKGFRFQMSGLSTPWPIIAGSYLGAGA